MRWEDGLNGGFIDGRPWLPLDPDGSSNVTGPQRNGRSILSLFRQLIALRREHPGLRQGGQQPRARIPMSLPSNACSTETKF